MQKKEDFSEMTKIIFVLCISDLSTGQKTCLQGSSAGDCRWLISSASSSLSPAGGNCEAGSQPGLDNLHPRYYYIFSTLFLRFNFTEDQWAVGGFKTLESKSCTILLKVDLKMNFL